MHPRLVLLVATLSFLSPLIDAHPLSEDMSAAANRWLASLTEDQRAKAVFSFGDGERMNWHFIPRERRGLNFKSMTHEQRMLAHALLSSGLSHRGYAKTMGVMSLDGVLAVLENNPVRRDVENYYFSLFGTPGEEPWGWRFEGHHVAFNFTLAGSSLSSTPNFLGSNPAEVLSGPRKGTRVLAAEEDLGRQLAMSLDDGQRRKAAILAEVPDDIFNVPGRKSTRAEGIAWGELKELQREALLAVVREYVHRFRAEIADEEMARLATEGFEKLHFAWVGGFGPRDPHYYRVQGGSFVLEYDKIQNEGNHVHAAWRDFDREFGADVLGEHYRASHRN